MAKNIKPNAVSLVTTCPKCHEPIELLVTKKELKLMLKGFKMGLRKGQLYSEKEIEKLRKREGE